jgi:hypothetical protein
MTSRASAAALTFAAFAIVLVVLLFYGGSYALLVERHEMHVYLTGTMSRVPVAHYRIGAEVAESFFQPIHSLDRWVRPGTWDAEEIEDLPADVGGFF